MSIDSDRELDEQAKVYQKLKPFLRAVPGCMDDEFERVPCDDFVSGVIPSWVGSFYQDDLRPKRVAVSGILVLWLPNCDAYKPPSFEQFRQAYYGGLS